MFEFVDELLQYHQLLLFLQNFRTLRLFLQFLSLFLVLSDFILDLLLALVVSADVFGTLFPLLTPMPHCLLLPKLFLQSLNNFLFLLDFILDLFAFLGVCLLRLLELIKHGLLFEAEQLDLAYLIQEFVDLALHLILIHIIKIRHELQILLH